MTTKNTKAFGTEALDADLKPMNIERRSVTPNDVEIDILFCGVCHSDLHTARNDWGGTIYPAVPGHEIVGRVTSVGAGVTKFKVGDLAGVLGVLEHHNAGHLRHRLQLQHPRHHRMSGEMPLKKGLVDGDVLDADNVVAVDLRDAIHH